MQRAGVTLASFGVILIGCYSIEKAEETCESCRGPGEPRIDLGTFADPADYGRPWMPWVPLPPDGTVFMATTPGTDLVVALNARTTGICWHESRFDWEVFGCLESDADGEILRTCAGAIPPDVLTRVFEDGPTQSIGIRPHLCPLTEEMKSSPVEVQITATEIGVERGLGGELCTENLRTTTDVFTFVPVCRPEDDDCREQCFGP